MCIDLRVEFSIWRHTFNMCDANKVQDVIFAQKSAAIWWVHTRRLPGAYASASACSWYVVHLYLFDQMAVAVVKANYSYSKPLNDT